MFKKATELAPGDKVQTESGNWVRVTEVTNGIFKGHLRVDFRGPKGEQGWSQVHHKTTLEIKAS